MPILIPIANLCWANG